MPPLPGDLPRRLCRTGSIRAPVRHTDLAATDLGPPLFVVHGAGVRRAIPSARDPLPLVAHNASGECAMVKSATRWLARGAPP